MYSARNRSKVRWNVHNSFSLASLKYSWYLKRPNSNCMCKISVTETTITSINTISNAMLTRISSIEHVSNHQTQFRTLIIFCLFVIYFTWSIWTIDLQMCSPLKSNSTEPSTFNWIHFRWKGIFDRSKLTAKYINSGVKIHYYLITKNILN